MRRYDLDHLRTIVILLLFPVHTAMIWNSFGEQFYIWDKANQALSTFIVLVNPWMMPLLFVIAGISAKYSLQKRTPKQFLKERFRRLMIPFIIGMVFLIPLQTLMARKYYFAYTGGIIENIGYFFTHVSDFSGYDGCFSPGHLWFLIYLFFISLTALPIFHFGNQRQWAEKLKKLSFFQIILLFIPIWLSYYIGNIGGYSLGKYLILYWIGYTIFSEDEIIARCVEKQKYLVMMFVIGEALLGILFYRFSYYGDGLVNAVGWLGVLTCMTIAHSFVHRNNKICAFFHQRSFAIYYYHQTILILLAYVVLKHISDTIFAVVLILAGSFVLTMAWVLIRDRVISFCQSWAKSRRQKSIPDIPKR